MSYYFSKKQESEFKPNKITANIGNVHCEFYTGSGVFSKERVDKGTELLINNAIMQDGWRVLDLGCGYGVAGIFIKKSHPNTRIVMVDLNARAVKLTKMNLKLNKVEADVLQSDLYEKVTGIFNTIIVNPPQKAGKEVCFKIIEESKRYLSRGGLLQLVARHNVGGKTLEKKMDEVFGNVEATAKKSGYRVYMSKIKNF